MDFDQRLEQRRSPPLDKSLCTLSESSSPHSSSKLETLSEDAITPLSFIVSRKFTKASPRIPTSKPESIESAIHSKLLTSVRFPMWKRSEHPSLMSTTGEISHYPHPTTHHAAWRKPCCRHKLDPFDR